jgi:peptide/nickel transport system permease protein
MSWFSWLWRGLKGDRLTQGALAVILLLLVASLTSPLLPIGAPDQVGYGQRLGAPSWQIPFGTDNLGRPVLARVLQGVQSTFLLSTIAVLISGLLGALVAMATAYAHPLVDEAANRAADIMFSFPPILLGILIVAVLSPGVMSVMVVIALITFPTMLRVVRAATLSVMRRDFVVVSEIAGTSFATRLFVHILPNVAEAIVVQMVYSISVGMLVESGMSFLGIGVQPPVASLGLILRDGISYLEVAPWLTFSAGLTLAAAIMATNLLGDGLRRIVDPIEQAG